MNKSMDAVEGGERLGVNGRLRIFVLAAVLIALGLSIYREVLWDLFLSVLHRQGASHGVCVPFIAAYLFWYRYDRVKAATPTFSLLPGVLLVGAGLGLFYIGCAGTAGFLPAFSFFLVAAGLVLALYGREVFKAVGFPIFFLAAMIPLPKPLFFQLTEWMRIATTWGSVGLVKLFHFPIHRDGYYITIPTTNLFIAESCSGIRYLIPYFVFGLAYVFVCKKTFLSRAAVMLATIPLAILGGVLRQSLIFLSATYISPVMAEHRPHVMISWFVFVTLLAGGIGLDRWVSGGREQTVGSKE